MTAVVWGILLFGVSLDGGGGREGGGAENLVEYLTSYLKNVKSIKGSSKFLITIPTTSPPLPPSPSNLNYDRSPGP